MNMLPAEFAQTILDAAAKNPASSWPQALSLAYANWEEESGGLPPSEAAGCKAAQGAPPRQLEYVQESGEFEEDVDTASNPY